MVNNPIGSLETITLEVEDGVATLTLNRPEAMNSFNQKMMDECAGVWHSVRDDDDVRVVVIRATGARAFSTGVDTKEGFDRHHNAWSRRDPALSLAPKSNHCWKPIVCAVNGMAAGGAFYWINESDIVICSDDATFFDPHVTYGLTSALEPAGLARRIPYGEVMRWALMGLDERMSAARAHQIGLVSEVVEPERLWERAAEIASIIARKPAAATQGTVKAVWELTEVSRRQAAEMGLGYTIIGNPVGTAQLEADPPAERPPWQLR
jgi:enoyl-CoA hydratase/carnithine racemase